MSMNGVFYCDSVATVQEGPEAGYTLSLWPHDAEAKAAAGFLELLHVGETTVRRFEVGGRYRVSIERER